MKRERVPFVLTDDFIHIIAKGGTKDSKEFLEYVWLIILYRVKGWALIGR